MLMVLQASKGEPSSATLQHCRPHLSTSMGQHCLYPICLASCSNEVVLTLLSRPNTQCGSLPLGLLEAMIQ